MKAAQLNQHKKDFKLVVNDIPVPEITDDEVLVKVKEAAINPLDKLIGTGSVKLIRNYSMPLTMGNELTGVIAKVGRNVRGYKKGDAIYTRLPLNKIGAFAEYVSISSDAIAKLPTNLNFKTGAAAALTGLTAYQGLIEELNVEAGKTLFIPGGSGSFGELAIPIAKSMGLTVIVSGNTRSKSRMLKLGADQYISYENQNYWEILKNVDYIIDTLGAKEFDHELSIIKPGGRLLSLRTGPNEQFAITHKMGFVKKQLFKLAGLKFDKKAKRKNVSYRFIFVRSNGNQLKEISKIIEKYNINPSVDSKQFHIQDINKALDYAFNSRTEGKVLISFEN